MKKLTDSGPSLAEVFMRYRPALLRMVERRMPSEIRSRVGSEEILQETWICARRRWPARTADGRASDYAWLYRLTLDTLLTTWRRESRGRRDAGRDLPWPAESSLVIGLRCVDTATSPSGHVARNELQEQMRRVVDRLSESDREVLWMRHQDDLRHSEIADVLGISESAANLRYFRAIRRLRDLWQAAEGGGTN